jgi:flagellar hook-length control protein FliK
VRLDPPELGSVRLTLESQGNQVRAVVETDNPRTLADLRTEAPALIQRLADSGIQVQSMDMVLTQQGSYHSQSQNPWQQQGWAQGQQQDLWQQQAGAGYADTRGLDGRGELVGASTVADNAINIWI